MRISACTFASPAVNNVHYFAADIPMILARDVRGYTLVELLTVLTILAVLCSLAVPTFAGMVDRVRARAALDQVEGDLYWGRVRAIRRGRNVTVRFQPDPNCTPTHTNAAAYRRYAVLVADASAPGGEREVRSAEIPTDSGKVCFEMNRSAELVFTSRGMLHAGQNRTLWATRGAATVTLRISRLGRTLRDD